MVRLGKQILQDFRDVKSTTECQKRLCFKISTVQIALRESRNADFEALWTIDQQCFPPGISYSRLELAAYIRRPKAFTIVAEEVPAKNWQPSTFKSSYGKRLQIAGFIVAEADPKSLGHIITIDVLTEHRRSGIGSQLLQAAEERLRLASCGAIVLEAAVDNETALAFYHRHGFTPFNRIAHYYPNGTDAAVLRKDLLSAPQAS